MIVISNWNDFEQFGIRFLTGEACGISMRLLCDLNEQGVNLITAFFGGNLRFHEGSNWNSQSIASVLLPRSIFPELGVFVLLHTGKATVVRVDYSDLVRGFHRDDPQYDELLKAYSLSSDRVYCNSGDYGTRNTHQFSGRTE